MSFESDSAAAAQNAENFTDRSLQCNKGESSAVSVYE